MRIKGSEKMTTATLTKRHMGTQEVRTQPRAIVRARRQEAEALLRDLAFVLKLTEQVKADIVLDQIRSGSC